MNMSKLYEIATCIDCDTCPCEAYCNECSRTRSPMKMGCTDVLYNWLFDIKVEEAESHD